MAKKKGMFSYITDLFFEEVDEQETVQAEVHEQTPVMAVKAPVVKSQTKVQEEKIIESPIAPAISYLTGESEKVEKAHTEKKEEVGELVQSRVFQDVAGVDNYDKTRRTSAKMMKKPQTFHHARVISPITGAITEPSSETMIEKDEVKPTQPTQKTTKSIFNTVVSPLYGSEIPKAKVEKEPVKEEVVVESGFSTFKQEGTSIDSILRNDEKGSMKTSQITLDDLIEQSKQNQPDVFEEISLFHHDADFESLETMEENQEKQAFLKMDLFEEDN